LSAGCEFLNKLDLTVNFVGDLLSVETLQANHNFRELYLTGNPCTDYEGYREFVVATLPRLQWLDGKEVSISERILAKQHYQELRERIIHQQKAYQAKREREKREHREKQEAESKGEKERERKSQPGFDGRWYTDTDSHTRHRDSGQSKDRESGQSAQAEDDEDREFWNEPTAYTPESRTEVHQYMAEKRKKERAKSPEGLQHHKRKVGLERDGKMLNVNEARYDFQLRDDDENNQFILEVAIPRYMDTSLVECDVQPKYVRLKIKGKVLQLVLDEEVSSDRSCAQRSQTSGHLVLTLPKAREIVKAARPRHPPRKKPAAHSPHLPPHHCSTQSCSSRSSASVPPQKSKSTPSRSTDIVDISNIVKREEEEEAGSRKTRGCLEHVHTTDSREGVSDDLILDDSDVPPLI
jgi:protein TilB